MLEPFLASDFEKTPFNWPERDYRYGILAATYGWE